MPVLEGIDEKPEGATADLDAVIGSISGLIVTAGQYLTQAQELVLRQEATQQAFVEQSAQGADAVQEGRRLALNTIQAARDEALAIIRRAKPTIPLEDEPKRRGYKIGFEGCGEE